jgi:hypothetical protein
MLEMPENAGRKPCGQKIKELITECAGLEAAAHFFKDLFVILVCLFFVWEFVLAIVLPIWLAINAILLYFYG